MQDTFLDLWTNRKKITITTSINSYLYGVVYNKIMDFYRNKKRRDESLTLYYNKALNDIEDNSEDYKEQKLKKLELCIEELPKRCKKVFYAKKIVGLKSQQIAEESGISLKTVEGHITKAYKLLKDCMATIPI